MQSSVEFELSGILAWWVKGGEGEEKQTKLNYKSGNWPSFCFRCLFIFLSIVVFLFIV